jgi:lipoyl(octanoyl) transferase
MGQYFCAVNNVYLKQLGVIDYKEAWDLQEKLLAEKVAIKTRNRDLPAEEQIHPPHHLLLCEHPHVYTLGKSGSENNLLVNDAFLKQINATYYKINRGGDITYHGPGQMVAYPILDLDQFFTDIHLYLRKLEEVIIQTIGKFGLQGGRVNGLTGVWIDADDEKKARKICAMGVRCSRWVTMHGLALNVNAHLEYFKHIVPCGITDKPVTSMEKELGHQVNFEEVQRVFKEEFAKEFDVTLTTA